eukprot:s1_g2273.t1
MRFIEYREMGDPATVLEIKTEESAPLKSGEVRVKVLATPIHPSNLLQIAGLYGTAPELPAIPGSEGIGFVEEIAPDVTDLSVGQRVLLTTGGTWRDEMTGPASAFVPLPHDGDVEQMSMLTVNPLTAHLILTSFTDLKPGDWIIQSAANSAVGEFIIQLAAQRGIKTINVVRRAELEQGLLELGADSVLVDGPDLAERVSAVTGGAPVVFAIDSVAGETFSRLVECLSFGGTLVAYGALSMQPPALNPTAIIFNDVRIRGFWLSKWFETASPEDKQAAFGEVIHLTASGAIKARIDARFDLDDIAAAVTRAAEPVGLFISSSAFAATSADQALIANGSGESWIAFGIILTSIATAWAMNYSAPKVRVYGTLLAALGCFAVTAWFMLFVVGSGILENPKPNQTPMDSAKPAFLWLQSSVAFLAGLLLLRAAFLQRNDSETLQLAATNETQRYGRVSRLLHWTIAILFISLIPMGIFTSMIPEDAAFRNDYYIVHKTIGVLVFVLILVRLAWNWHSKRPDLDPSLKPWERKLAHGVHIALYGLMIAFPITGYVMTSMHGFGTYIFVWEIPPFLDKSDAYIIWGTFHKYLLPYLLYIILGAHVLGALKHHFIDKHQSAFKRMVS